MGRLRRSIYTAGIILSIWGLCCFLIPTDSSTTIVSWDDVMYEADADYSIYDAKNDMELSESILTGKLQNVSTGDAGQPSMDLLNSLGFDLPPGISITGGTAKIDRFSTADPAVTGAYSIGPTDFALSEGDFDSGEWVWGQGIGPFNTVVPGLVDWDISRMQASTASLSSGTPIAPPSGLNGPESGLGSGSLSASEAVGSPNTIPDATTLFLLGSACLVGFFSGFRRKFG
jgi:hypothetical protein